MPSWMTRISGVIMEQRQQQQQQQHSSSNFGYWIVAWMVFGSISCSVITALFLAVFTPKETSEYASVCACVGITIFLICVAIWILVLLRYKFTLTIEKRVSQQSNTPPQTTTNGHSYANVTETQETPSTGSTRGSNHTNRTRLWFMQGEKGTGRQGVSGGSPGANGALPRQGQAEEGLAFEYRSPIADNEIGLQDAGVVDVTLVEASVVEAGVVVEDEGELNAAFDDDDDYNDVWPHLNDKQINVETKKNNNDEAKKKSNGKFSIYSKIKKGQNSASLINKIKFGKSKNETKSNPGGSKPSEDVPKSSWRAKFGLVVSTVKGSSPAADSPSTSGEHSEHHLEVPQVEDPSVEYASVVGTAVMDELPRSTAATNQNGEEEEIYEDVGPGQAGKYKHVQPNLINLGKSNADNAKNIERDTDDNTYGNVQKKTLGEGLQEVDRDTQDDTEAVYDNVAMEPDELGSNTRQDTTITNRNLRNIDNNTSEGDTDTDGFSSDDEPSTMISGAVAPPIPKRMCEFEVEDVEVENVVYEVVGAQF